MKTFTSVCFLAIIFILRVERKKGTDSGHSEFRKSNQILNRYMGWNNISEGRLGASIG